jgi:lipopolysaccharide transport system permease protein
MLFRDNWIGGPAPAPALSRPLPKPVIYDAARPRHFERAVQDFASGMSRWRLAVALAWLDIRNRYRGSVLGPFWLTLSTALMLFGLGLLYSTLFHLSVKSYLPYLSVSIIIWNMISQVATESCTSLTAAAGFIRQLPLPYSTHALRCVFRNAVVAAHNFPLLFVVLAFCHVSPGLGGLLAVPGLAVLAAGAFAAALFLGMLCARFRDLAQIVVSLMQLAFFMSPILWKPETLGADARWLPLNPFYTIMEVIRGPLLGTGMPVLIWVSAPAYTLAALTFSFLFFVRFRSRIAFWV